MSATTPIQRATAAYFSLKIEMLKTGPSSYNVVRARHIARYLERELEKRSYPELAAIYDRDHTSMLASCNHVRARLAADDQEYVVPVAGITEAASRLTVADDVRQMASAERAAVRAAHAIEELSCPTCGAPVVAELKRQLATMAERLAKLETR